MNRKEKGKRKELLLTFAYEASCLCHCLPGLLLKGGKREIGLEKERQRD